MSSGKAEADDIGDIAGSVGRPSSLLFPRPTGIGDLDTESEGR